MISRDDIDRVMGRDVYDKSGDKIGSAIKVYLDDETRQPEWVTVRTGLFGIKESFVPIRDADLTDEGVRVHVSKDKVKDAPKIDTDGHLSPQEEEELYRYYRLGVSMTATETTGMGQSPITGTLMGQAGPSYEMTDVTTTDPIITETAARGYAGDEDARGTVGQDTSGPTTDSAVTRPEEPPSVGRRSEEVGRDRLRKYVASENATENR
jgi:hypothetical protein